MKHPPQNTPKNILKTVGKFEGKLESDKTNKLVLILLEVQVAW